jgi:rhodanese-related sulfurtransferase/rubrerythrin
MINANQGLPEHNRGVVNITAQQLQGYMASHPNGEYALIDVRERHEYKKEHIPGAKHLPLSELNQRLGEIQALPEPNRIFYCRSGSRSGRAAAALSQTLGLPGLFNLAGGILAYNGQTVDDFPRLSAVDRHGSVAELLHRALDMEKGADRLYTALRPYFRDSRVEKIIDSLSQAEQAHGRTVHQALRRIDESLPDFEQHYAALPGDLLEDGRTYDDAVQRAKAMLQRFGQEALLDIALEVEYRAYDLYRALAHEITSDAHRKTFLDLAAQEQRHVKSVLRAFNEIAAN